MNISNEIQWSRPSQVKLAARNSVNVLDSKSDAMRSCCCHLTAKIEKFSRLRPRKDKRGVDLISDALPFGRLWYEQVTDAIEYSKHRCRSRRPSFAFMMMRAT
jgi:hypothetical protein